MSRWTASTATKKGTEDRGAGPAPVYGGQSFSNTPEPACLRWKTSRQRSSIVMPKRPRPPGALCFTSKMSEGCAWARPPMPVSWLEGADARSRSWTPQRRPSPKSIVVEEMPWPCATAAAPLETDRGPAGRRTCDEPDAVHGGQRLGLYLIKGGRIGKVTGRAASILGIKPMISFFKESEIFSAIVAVRRQKSFERRWDS